MHDHPNASTNTPCHNLDHSTRQRNNEEQNYHQDDQVQWSRSPHGKELTVAGKQVQKRPSYRKSGKSEHMKASDPQLVRVSYIT